MQNLNNTQMLLFITVTSLDDEEPIELNPAFIMYMQRHDEYIPYTTLTLTAGPALKVRETPSEIAELQLKATMDMMSTVMGVTTRLLQEMSEELDGLY